MLLREYLEKSWSKTALTQKLGISRRTIYRWAAISQLDRDLDVVWVRYSKRPSVRRKVDPYLGIIQTRLAQFPKLGKALHPEDLEVPRKEVAGD